MLKTLSRNTSLGSSGSSTASAKDVSSPKKAGGIGKLFGKSNVLTRVASGLKKSNSGVKVETPRTLPLSGKEVSGKTKRMIIRRMAY